MPVTTPAPLRELHLDLETEVVPPHSWPSTQTARTAVLEYIEGFYKTGRRHSALGHPSPSVYEGVRLRGGTVV